MYICLCIDCFFVAQMYATPDVRLSMTCKWLLVGVGVSFIILPLICNLIQLHCEIHKWVTDVYSKHTVQAWVRSYLRILYVLSFFCGSAFAATNICNSNIFHLSMFNMGLNRRQRAIFKNQRVLSIVLLENIPQLIIQAIYIGITENFNEITIMAMIFSIISIISSIFDYQSSSLFIQCESITVLEMNIESKELSDLPRKNFRQMITHHRNPICGELAKVFCMNWKLIEMLIPIQTNFGAKLIVYIRNNDINDENFGSTIVDTIGKVIDSGELGQVMFLHFFCVFNGFDKGCSITSRAIFCFLMCTL